MAEPLTRPTGEDVDTFLAAVPDERRRADARVVRDLLTRITGEPAVMWGAAIVGFGTRRLRYAGGREVDWPLIGFSPRKASTTIYLADSLEHHTEVLSRLGPHATGRGCLYVKRLDDVDRAALEELLTRSVERAGVDGDG